MFNDKYTILDSLFLMTAMVLQHHLVLGEFELKTPEASFTNMD